MGPCISIIIPIYNVEKYLHQCLNSILRQTFQDWECILINDGSTDSSGVICDKYSRQDGRFKVIHKANGGVSSARNEGLNVAVGKWLCFVDSDDRMVEDALEHMLELTMKKEADVCICPFVKEGLSQFETKVLNDSEKNELIWSCLTYRTSKFASKGLLVDSPWAKLFRMSIVRDNNIRYVIGLCKSEDALFNAEYYHYSSRIVLDTYSVYYYTVNPNSICHTYNMSHIGMLGTLLDLEHAFVCKFYANQPEFDNVVKVRAFSALNQVLFESDARKRTLSERKEALQTFFMSGNVDSIIRTTKYSEIKPYFSDCFRHFDFWLAKGHMFTFLCLWIDLCIVAFNVRVRMVSKTKQILGISQERSLSSIFQNNSKQ